MRMIEWGRVVRFWAVGCVVALLLGGCSVPQSGDTGTAIAGDSREAVSAETVWAGEISPALGITMEWKKADLGEDYDPNSAVVVTLRGDSISVVGEGATAAGRTLTISASGTYIISGALANGQIRVDAGGDDKVHLVLDGVTVKNDHTAPFYVLNADKTTVTLVEGTVNTFTDTANYQFSAGDDDPKGAFYSKDDLTINGGGTLVVEGNYRHGIVSKDNLKIVNATIMVTAVHHAIKGNDMVAIRDATLVVRAGKDGIHSHTAGVGFIYIESGDLDIIAGGDCMQAETALVIVDGEFSLAAGGGHTVSPKQSQEAGPGGRRPGATTLAPGGGASTAATVAMSGSYKGLKARAEIIIHGGIFNIDACDDAIHSDGTITINGGIFALATGDDAIHADKEITVNGGEITVVACYEGIESSSITINDGTIRISARDDGINGASRKSGGNAGGGMGQAPGGQPGGMAAGTHSLTINGGYIYVNADGDGIDVNGTITMTGGTVVVNGPLAQMDGALDFDRAFTLSGGAVIASGSAGMVQSPLAVSQGVISLVLRGLSTGTIVNVVDSRGVSVLTYSSAKQYESLVFSLPSLIADSTYQVYAGGDYTGGTATDGVHVGGAYSGGSLLGTVTASLGGGVRR